MIIKGSSRGQSAADAKRLARHLLSAENEQVELIALNGVAASDLQLALEEMRAVSLGTRVRRALYHASVSPTLSEAASMDRRRWIEAVEGLERHLGLVGHQRAIVLHVKRGRPHVHVVWGRAHPVSLKVARDSCNYERHERCARALETRWGLQPVVGVHTRPGKTPRPVAQATHQDWQAAERTGIDVQDVAAVLQEAWRSTACGKEFAAAIHRASLLLARGRRGIVAVDAAGTVHALPRRLGVRAAEVLRKLSDIDSGGLPEVQEIRTRTRRVRASEEAQMQRTFSVCEGRAFRGSGRVAPHVLTPDYWRSLGFSAEVAPELLMVLLPGGTILHDRGNRLTLTRDGEPTGEEIRLIVAAGKARGWQSIRFYGSSPEWQRRARAEAIRQGYRLDQISLECEDSMEQRGVVATPVPAHIRRRLTPPDAPEPPLASSRDTAAPTPTQEARP